MEVLEVSPRSVSYQPFNLGKFGNQTKAQLPPPKIANTIPPCAPHRLGGRHEQMHGTVSRKHGARRGRQRSHSRCTQDTPATVLSPPLHPLTYLHKHRAKQAAGAPPLYRRGAEMQGGSVTTTGTQPVCRQGPFLSQNPWFYYSEPSGHQWRHGRLPVSSLTYSQTGDKQEDTGLGLAIPV